MAKSDNSFWKKFVIFPGTPNSLWKNQLMLLGRVALARHRHGADWCPQGFRTGWSRVSIRNSRAVPKLLLKKKRESDLLFNEVRSIAEGETTLGTHQIAILHPKLATA